VLLRKPRSPNEVLNDLDGDIVNVLRVLRDRPGELERRVRLTPFSQEEFHATYGDPPADPVERARWTLVRQMFGFGTSGLVRSHTGFRHTSHRNRHQGYAHDWARYPDSIRSFCERLRGVVISREPALACIDRHDVAGALFYVDPSYVHSTRGPVGMDGKNGYRHEMDDADHEELAGRLHACEAAVVLSGYRCDLYDRLYASWRRLDRSHYSQGQRSSVRRTESLWLSPAAVSRGAQRTLFGGRP
jgi:DNA adenine methylase